MIMMKKLVITLLFTLVVGYPCICAAQDSQASSGSGIQGHNLRYELEAENTFDLDEVTKLVSQLADKEFHKREEAENRLATFPWHAITVMNDAADLFDPEVRERLAHAVSEIQKTPRAIPRQTLGWTTGDKQLYQRELAKFMKEHASLTGVSQSQMTRLDEVFAQSFIASSNKIDAIAVGVMPTGNASGWLRLTVHADDDQHPSRAAIAECWIKVPTKGPVPQDTTAWIIFDLPDISVQANRTYWFIVSSYSDKRGTGPVAGYRVSSSEYPESTDYKHGTLWRGNQARPSDGSDACFLIYTEIPEFPLLRRATEEELQGRPAPEERKATWHKDDQP